MEKLNSKKFENLKKYKIKNFDKILGGETFCTRDTRVVDNQGQATYDKIDTVRDVWSRGDRTTSNFF